MCIIRLKDDLKPRGVKHKNKYIFVKDDNQVEVFASLLLDALRVLWEHKYTNYSFLKKEVL